MRGKQAGQARGWAHSMGIAAAAVALTLSLAGGTPSRSGTGEARAAGGGTLRIGYQAFGDLNVLKSKGTLEKALAVQGVSVVWTKFTSGPPLLEALNAGSIDVGSTGAAPPIFAQAAGVPLVYVAAGQASPRTEAILVRSGSPIHSVAELRGKTVVLAKASSAHYLLVAALAAAHVPYNAVHTLFLQPADARAAFEQGSVDAWSVWDPYYAMEQHSTGTRVLTTGEGIDQDLSFYLAARSYATAHGDILRVLLRQLKVIDGWVNTNTTAVAAFLAPQVGIDLPSLTTELKRSHYGVGPISPATVVAQQAVADTFLKLKLIPKRVQISDDIWSQAAQPI